MKSLIRFFLVLSVAFLGLTQSDAQAASGHRTGAIAGVVLDSAGHPVADAAVEIEIHTANGHVFQARTHTDRQGHFGFRHVPEGRGAAKARKRGVGHSRVGVRVKAGHTTRVRIDI